MDITAIVSRTPVLGSLARRMALWRQRLRFRDSGTYWEERYAGGGTSWTRNYDEMADWKGQVVNDFVEKHGVTSVIEYGCGDGNQLARARYPRYLGFDVSSTAIQVCQTRFIDDRTKTFKLVGSYAGERADLTLSLDVIYHLIEDQVFGRYMTLLFASSDRYVIIFSTDTNKNDHSTPHIRHRRFTDWVTAEAREWKLMQRVPNKHANAGRTIHFYIYEKIGH